LQTWKAVYLQVAEYIHNVDDGGTSQTGNGYSSLCIHFPLLMRPLNFLGLWFWKFMMALILLHKILLLEICCNPRTAREFFS